MQLQALVGVVGVLVLGIFLARLKRVPGQAVDALNFVVIHVSLPAMIFRQIQGWKLELEEVLGAASGYSIWFPVGSAWVLFLVSILFFFLLGKKLRWSRSRIGCLILTAGLANTSFLGFPLIEAYFGQDALQTAILVDQPGSFLVISTLGVWIASANSAHRVNWVQLLRKVLLFPGTLALVAGVLARSFSLPRTVDIWIDRFAETLIPLALLSVGMQLKLDFGALKRYRVEVIAGLLYKLALGPALIFALSGVLGDPHGWVSRISVVEVAMAPMIMGAVLAMENGLERQLAALMLSVGIPLSFLTVPFWVFVTNL